VEYTEEQKNIMSRIVSTDPSNVLINSKAGSGKTTTALGVAKAWYTESQSATLLLTYSSLLKTETRARAKALGLTSSSLQVESFHSAVQNILMPPASNCHNSTDLQSFLARPEKCISEDYLSRFGLLIVDEVQDLTSAYYNVIQRLRSQMGPHKLILVGDYFQCIFRSLQNSVTEYMEDPEKHFGGSFVWLPLSISFRLSKAMVDWISLNLNPLSLEKSFPDMWARKGELIRRFWGNGVLSDPSRTHRGSDVTEISTNVFSGLGTEAMRILKEWTDLDPSDVALLVTSLNNRNTPGRIAVNHLNTVAWYVKDTKLNTGGTPQNFFNKAVVTTPWSFKGCERKRVIFLGMDDYIEASHRRRAESDPDWALSAYCLAYVSCTRASEHLMVVSHRHNDVFCTHSTRRHRSEKRATDPIRTTARGLVSYVPYDTRIDASIEEGGVLNVRTVLELTQPAPKLEFLVAGECPGTFEYVGDFLTAALCRQVSLALQKKDLWDWPELVSRVMEEDARRSGFLHRIRQLDGTEWVNVSAMQQIMQNVCAALTETFSKDITVRKNVAFSDSSNIVSGYMNLVLDDRHAVNIQLSPPTIEDLHVATVGGFLLEADHVYVIDASKYTKIIEVSVEDRVEHFSLLLLRKNLKDQLSNNEMTRGIR
jgi:hypothetical protein